MHEQVNHAKAPCETVSNAPTIYTRHAYHWIPGRQDDLVATFEDLDELLWSQRLRDNDLVHESARHISIVVTATVYVYTY